MNRRLLTPAPAAGTSLLPRAVVAIVVASLVAAAPSRAQGPADTTSAVPRRPEQLSLSGPRFGITLLTGALVDTARARADVGRVFTQFGWQFERVFYSVEGGPRAVNEWVLLVGGLDQGTAIPSLTWLVGLRSSGGAEVGVGPNLSPTGVALAVAGGVTARAGYMHVPLNLAVVPSRYGARISLLSGFTFRR